MARSYSAPLDHADGVEALTRRTCHIPQGDCLAGPFAPIVVDEAQELTDAEWQMLLRRCPSRSFTIVGDRAQARHGFTESWQERLERIGLDTINLASLSINYQTPQEVMVEAVSVIRPCSRPPTSRPPSAAAGCPSSTARLPTWTRYSIPDSPRTPKASPASLTLMAVRTTRSRRRPGSGC